MQPIRSRVNQYRGINAHLHSHWQLEGGWAGFHTNHITDLMRLLRTQLLPMGYTAELESSLQIRHVDAMPESPESDVTIYDLESERTARPSGLPATMAGVLVLPAPEILARSPLSEKEFNSILAYLTKKTFDETLYGLELVDYNQLPERFERYSRADQARIARRMVTVLETDHRGIDLEKGPFPIQEMSIEAAFERFEVLRQQN